jgi:hypothetical protein
MLFPGDYDCVIDGNYYKTDDRNRAFIWRDDGWYCTRQYTADRIRAEKERPKKAG